MFRITELLAVLLVVGGLVLVGFRVVSWEQGVAVITLGVGLVTGKFFASIDRSLDLRFLQVAVAFRLAGMVSMVKYENGILYVWYLPGFHDEVARRVFKIIPKYIPVILTEGEKVVAV